MSIQARLSWLSLIVAGACYGLVGIVFALPTSDTRVWRLAAWAISGVIYIGHIVYERYWLRSGLLTTAVHVALGVAVGGFVLAVGANVHAAMTPLHAAYWRYRLALGAWPIITAGASVLVVRLVALLVYRGLVVTASAACCAAHQNVGAAVPCTT